MSVSQRSVLPVVFVLVILSPLAIDVYLPSLPEMVRVFGVDDGAMQFTISLFMMFMGAGQLLAGPLSDRFGRRSTALLGTALYIVGSLLGADSEQMSDLYLSRILQGLGAASCSVTAFAWVRDHYNALESGKWISYMGGMIGTIPTLAPFLGGVLAARWGWPSSFIFMAIAGGFLFLSSFLFLESGKPSLVPSRSAPDKQTLKENIVEILSHRQFLIYSLTGTLTMGGILAYATNAPLVAMNMAGMDEFGFATVFGALGILQLLASIVAPRVVDKIGRRRTVMTGAILSLVGAAGLLLVPESSPLVFFIPSAAGCIGFNLIFGTASGLTLEHFKHCSGLAASIDGFARMTGGGLVAVLIKLLGFHVFGTTALAYSLLVLPLFLIISDLNRTTNQITKPELKQAA